MDGHQQSAKSKEQRAKSIRRAVTDSALSIGVSVITQIFEETQVDSLLEEFAVAHRKPQIQFAGERIPLNTNVSSHGTGSV